MKRARPAAGLIVGGLLALTLGIATSTGSGPLARPHPQVPPAASPNWGEPDQAVAAVRRPVAGRHATFPIGTSRLSLNRTRSSAPVVPVVEHGGVLQVPRDPAVLGWWSGGARPGDPAGSAVLVGHVDYAGVSGILAGLAVAARGDEIVLSAPSSGTERLRYRITAVRSYPKSTGIPADAFSRTGPSRLVLITCGGRFDERTGSYVDNVVAYASPEPAGD